MVAHGSCGPRCGRSVRYGDDLDRAVPGHYHDQVAGRSSDRLHDIGGVDLDRFGHIEAPPVGHSHAGHVSDGRNKGRRPWAHDGDRAL